MQTIDRAAFFTAYRRLFRRLHESQVKPIEDLLSFMENDHFLVDLRWASYMLATVKLETADTFLPIREYGTYGYFEGRYGWNTRKGKELGNKKKGEGSAYAGAGLVQLTGAYNYAKAEQKLRDLYPDVIDRFEAATGKTFDLTVGDQANDEKDPANALYPEIAYAIMSAGMREGWFTGAKLSQYIGGNKTDYIGARHIINGTDKANIIAGYAEDFFTCLQEGSGASKVPEEAASIPTPTIAIPEATKPVAASEVALATQVSTEPEKSILDKLKSSTTFLQASGVNIGTGITAGIGSVWSVVSGNTGFLYYFIVAAVTLIALVTLGYFAKEGFRIWSEHKTASNIAIAAKTEPSSEQVAAIEARVRYQVALENLQKTGKADGIAEVRIGK